MAKLTKNEKYIVEMYVRYFGKVPTDTQIADYADLGKPKEILKQIEGDANDAKPSNIAYNDYIDSIFQNLFGRPASGPEKTKYAKTYNEKGVLPINAIVKAAKPTDKAIYQTKTAVALFIAEEGSTTNIDLDKITKYTYKEIYNPKTKKLSVDTVAQLETKIDKMPDNVTVTGKTFNLTASADTFVGSDKGDVFNAYEEFISGGARNTLTSIDSLDGGAGKDVLNVKTDSAIVAASATIKNIETINLESGAGVTFDTTTYTGVETLNVRKATYDVDLTASATTDVNVSGVNDSDAAVATAVTGGKTVTINQSVKDNTSTITVDKAVNVDVTLTDLSHTSSAINVLDIGSTNAVTGTVDVTVSGAKIVGGAATATLLNNIEVNGGTVVNVTQKATSDMGDIATTAADTTKDKVTQGAIVVNATTVTTEVNVKQDAAQTGVVAANTTGAVTETASVKFGALKTGDKLTIESTSNNSIDTGEFTLTAVKDMSATEVAAAFANLVNGNAYGSLIAAGDTQSGAAFTKGTYTGLDTLWTSAAANGDTVVFTSNTANNIVADIDFLLTNTSNNSVAPIVTTTQGKAHNATKAGGELAVVAGKVTVAANAALKTVTIDSYGTSSEITGTAAALATINLKNGAAFTVSDTADTVTLTLENVIGATTFTAQPKTLNVKSIGDNIGVVANANTTAFNVSGTGTLTQSGSLAAVKNITVTETAGLNLTSATLTALESIDATATTGAVTVSISGTQTTYAGSKGVDTVTVSDAGTKIAKAIDLGAGNDKLTLVGATVAIPTAELKGGEGTDTLSIDAASAVTLSGATAFAAKLNSFERLEITGATGIQSVDVEKLGFANYVTVAGQTTSNALTLSNLANNATVVLNAAAVGLTTNIKDAETGTADVLNLVVTNDSSIAAGTVTAANIETINLTVTDVFVDSSTPKDGKDNNDATHTMTLKADTATSLSIDGTAGLTLTLDGTTTKLVTIDASKMTDGGLEVTANGKNAMTITGGAGADVLTASIGANAKADILVGGAGNDILTAGSNGAKLTGGAGNDLFILTAANATSGTKNALTATEITDFKAGDLLQLSFYNDDANSDSSAVVNTFDSAYNVANGAVGGVISFAKLTAVMNPAESTLNDYVKAAITQAKVGEAVWFTKGNDSYVVIDSGKDSATTFVDTQDMIIQLTGVSLTNASFNAEYATVSL